MSKRKNQLAQAVSFNVNDIVFAKLRGYAIWPAKVRFRFSTHFHLYFVIVFGSVCYAY